MPTINRRQSKKINWYRFGQKKGPYLSRDISFSRILFKDHLRNIPHFGFTLDHYKHIDWVHYMDRDEIYATYRMMIRNMKGSIHNLHDFYQRAVQAHRRVQLYTKALHLKCTQKISNRQLSDFFDEWCDIKTQTDANVFCGNYLVRALSQEVEKKAKRFFPTLTDMQLKDRLMILSYDNRETVFYRREKDMLRFACRVATKKDILRRSYHALPHVVREDLRKLFHKYAWIQIMFLIYKPTRVEDMWKETRELVKESPREKLREMREKKTKALRDRDVLFKAIRPDKRFRLLLSLLRESSWIESQVIRFFEMSDYTALPFLHYIARRLGLSYTELIALRTHEIICGLKTGVLPLRSILRRRNDAFGIYFDRSKGKLLFLDSQKSISRYREKTDVLTTTEVHGMIASPGTVRGKVRIILDVGSIGNFRAGEILVTTMTTPAFVIAMRKAAAIVTNDGGITCHAAIISRELGKPCVIGTKNATEVFKNGDRVEVDATKGIVKKVG